MTEVVFSPDSEAFEAAKSAQARAADPERSAWVEANAGSGKTKVLIDRVTRLLLRRPDGRPGAAPNSILCITYTKAAANEMLTRLFARLGDWSVLPDDKLRKELAHLEGASPARYAPEDLRQARALFAQALETPGGLRIETIHAFCARILRRFPLEAGISPGFQELEDSEADRLWQGVLAARLEQAAATQADAVAYLSQVTGGRGVQAALDALKFQRQALLRFARRVDEGASLDAVIRAACGAEAVSSEALLSDAMGNDLPMLDIQKAVAELAGMAKPGKSDTALLDRLTALITETEPKARYGLYMAAVAGASGNFPAASNPFTKSAGDTVKALFTRDVRKGDGEGREITRLKQVQQRLLAVQNAERTLALMQIGLPLVRTYAEEKRRRAALDFDDLIARTEALLTHSNAAEWVLYKLDGGLSHLLLDEAQDTSPAQWAVINALVAEFQSGAAAEREGQPRTQFIVGDPKQSIYSFQGADQDKFIAEAEAFMRREEPLAIAEGREVNRPEMAMSFRSTPEVLGFVDAVRRTVPLNDAATDPLPPPDANLTPHAPRRLGQSGLVELWPLTMPDDSAEADNPWTSPTDHRPAHAPRRRLARDIARHIKAMLTRGDTVWKEHADGGWRRTPLTPQDILILVRSRNDMFDSLIENLKQEDIPVAGADRLRLLDNIGVQDCLNLIRFAIQPGDDLTLAEILRGPFCGLTDDDHHLFPLAYDRAPGETLWHRLAASDAAIFAPARAFCQTLIERRALPAFEFLNAALLSRDVAGLSGWDRLLQRLGEPARDPVLALLNAALGHDMRGPASLLTWLDEIEARDVVLKRELGEPDGAVRVMTVHGAKGLQAPLVILPDTTGATKKGNDPLYFNADGVPLYSPSKASDSRASAALREQADIASEKESRRLLYVALTRASDRLIIAGAGLANTKTGYGSSSWYRWCRTAMCALLDIDADADTSRETVLRYGAQLPQLSPQVLGEGAPTPTAPDWLYRPAPATAPPLRLAAPSRLLEDDGPVLQPFGARRAEALRRGQLIHGLLQILPLMAEAEREAVAWRYVEKSPELSQEAASEIVATTLNTLSAPEFAGVFAPGGRSEAAIVGTLPGGQMVNGRVDRLRITPEAIEIIDYKTDRPAPKTLSDISPAYIVQMAAYRAVLQQIYPDGRAIRCALLYTDGPFWLELPSDLLSESLNRITSAV